MQITLDPRKSVEQNAEVYFEHAKKFRKKAQGAREAIVRLQQKITLLEKKQEREPLKKPTVVRKREWFEKFHWFYSSDGFLCIGGRDATTNEVVIKKHTEAQDIVFHTEAPGSPFFVIKSEGKTIPETTIREAAEATAAYSKAWKLGLTTTEVYWVTPQQVSKTTPSGEYAGHGAFMVAGKRNYLAINKMEVGIGIHEGKLIGGPVTAIRKQCENVLVICLGKEKSSDCAKQIQHLLKAGELDEIIAFIPAGGCQLDKTRKTENKKS